MKLQKTKKSSKLEQASTLLNQIDDNNLHQVAAGYLGNNYIRTPYTNPDPNDNSGFTRAV